MRLDQTTKCKECVDDHERRKDYLTTHEISQLLAAAKRGRHGQRDYLLCLMAYRHGLRVSELIGIRISDIDLRAGRLSVHRLKGGLGVQHPIEGDELRAIKTHLKARREGHLFLSERGTPLTRQAISYLLREISGRAGLPHVNPHMLRHSCGYYLANRGNDLRLIQDYLGHRSPEHTARYTRTASVRFESLWK